MTRLRLLWRGVVGGSHRQTRGERRHPNKRRCTPLSIVTHLSEDRLPQLHGLCLALTTGNDDTRTTTPTSARRDVITICAVILVERPTETGYARTLRAIHALPGVGRQLIVRLECYSVCRVGDQQDKKNECYDWYPINQLRNKALALAETDLVLICDVDFRPCWQLANLVRNTGACTTLLKRASRRLNCIVLPAFEAIVKTDCAVVDWDTQESSASNPTAAQAVADDVQPLDESWWIKTLGSKPGVLQQWGKGRVVSFASQVWPPGHRATDFARWRRATAPYEVAFEEGFEPFVIMHRLLVPPFDERFEGYGRNKVIFFYRLNALGFSFMVDPELFLVHSPHLPSDSWDRTFGQLASSSPSAAPMSGTQSERFAAILSQYKVAKVDIDAETMERRCPAQTHGRGGRRNNKLLRLKRKTLGRWSSEGARREACRLYYGNDVVMNANTAMRTDWMRHALSSTMHALWYEYHPKPVVVVTRLESRLDRRDSDVTVITQCSLSRLSRLERMCSLWTGVLSVAIIAERGGSVGRRMRRLTSALHKKVELGGKCRLDMYLCEPSSGPAARDGLYPMNALRNIALDQARTDLVLLLDIDTMPMRNLHEIMTSPPAHDQLLAMCQGANETTAEAKAAAKPTLVVVPALEFVGASSPDDTRIRSLLDEAIGNKRAAAQLVRKGEMRAFHAKMFPAGHGPSDLDLWCALSADAPPYEVEHARGYEPYGLFSRRHAPRFDERFRGFGLDKVSYCEHLARLGWAFRAWPAAFLVDLPHPFTKHKNAYRNTPTFRAAVDGLFQRFSNEVDRSVVVVVGINNPPSGIKKSEAYVTARSSLSADASSPRDYEAMVGLSLLAWGDAWSRRWRGGTDNNKCGGSGWDLKGGEHAWAGILPASDEGDSGGTTDASDGVLFPRRMVGDWVRVRIGGGRRSGDVLGLRARSSVRSRPMHGVLRYWVRPRWDSEAIPRGKLPGLGMSGDVRFFVRWYSGRLGRCSLMRLGQRLRDICKVDVILDTHFLLENGRATSIQLEIDARDARRSTGTDGAVSFRAWADGDVVYEARVCARDASDIAAGEMRVEDVLFHVLTADEGVEKDKRVNQKVFVGGVEVWGQSDRVSEKPMCAAETGANASSTITSGLVAEKNEGNFCGVGHEKENTLGLPGIPYNPEAKLRFVFVASTGRCGTHFLSRLLGTAPGVLSVHEAPPTLAGHETLLAAARCPEESYSKRRHKADAILRSAQEHLEKTGSGSLTYVDTTHVFLKSFSDVVMRELAPHFPVDVIVLRRDPAAVLKSRIELGHFCRRQKRRDWLLLPDRCRARRGEGGGGFARDCAVCREGDEHMREAGMDGFEAHIAYAAETEDKIRTFRRRYERRNPKQPTKHKTPNNDEPPPHPPASESPPPRAVPLPASPASCNVIETSLESLTREEGVRQLFAELNLHTSGQTWDMVRAGATNTRGDEKHRVVPLEYCRERIRRAATENAAVDGVTPTK